MKLRFVLAAGVALVLFFFEAWVLVAMGVSTALLVSHLANRDLRRKVEAKRRELGELDFDALAAMEAADIDPTEYVFIGPAFMGLRPAVIDVMVEQKGPGTLRVVVRGSTEVLFYTDVRLDGFRIDRDGPVRSLNTAELDAID